MLKGLRVPVAVTPAGGAATIENYPVVDQNVLLSILPADTLHPWAQGLTPDEDTIFEINDDRIGGLMVSHIRRVFEEMHALGYARLLPGTRGISYVKGGRSDGEAWVVVNYINLESGRLQGFKVPTR